MITLTYSREYKELIEEAMSHADNIVTWPLGHHIAWEVDESLHLKKHDNNLCVVKICSSSILVEEALMNLLDAYIKGFIIGRIPEEVGATTDKQ